MAKYSEEFKLSILTEYHSGKISERKLCKKYGIARNSFTSWQIKYKIQGLDGLKRKENKHLSAEEKKEIITLSRTENYSNKECMEKINIRTSQIHKWEKELFGQKLPVKPKVSPKLPPSADEFSKLQTENECLRAEVEYLKNLKALVLTRVQQGKKQK